MYRKPTKQQYKDYVSATQAIRQGLIPWIHSIPTLTKWIKRQMKDPENSVLTIRVAGRGQGRRYYILKDSLKGISNVKHKGPTKGIIRI